MALFPVIFGSLEARADFQGDAAFEKVWSTARDHFWSASLAAQNFTVATHDALLAQAKSAQDPDQLAAIINPFLATLHISHTDFYTTSDLEFGLFQSMFGTGQLDQPMIFHIGVQGVSRPDGSFEIMAVMDDSPADHAGLLRGDLIVSIEGRAFHPGNSFQSMEPKELEIARGDSRFTVSIAPLHESIQTSFSMQLG